MSEISSGRPWFPLSVDIGANKKLRECGAWLCQLSQQGEQPVLKLKAKCVLLIFLLPFLFVELAKQHKSISENMSSKCEAKD